MKENQKKLLSYIRSNSPLTISAKNLALEVPFEINTYKLVKGKRVLRGIITRSISRQAMRLQLKRLEEKGYLKADYTSTQFPKISITRKRFQ